MAKEGPGPAPQVPSRDQQLAKLAENFSKGVQNMRLGPDMLDWGHEGGGARQPTVHFTDTGVNGIWDNSHVQATYFHVGEAALDEALRKSRSPTSH